MEHFSNDDESLKRQGDRFLEMGEIDKAISSYLGVESRNSATYLALAKAYEKAQKWDKVLENIEQYFKFDPNYLEACRLREYAQKQMDTDEGENTTNARPSLLGEKPQGRDIFISYRQRDSETLAKHLEEKLLNEGYEVWLDRSSRENLHDIVEIVKSCRIFLFLMSSSIFESKWCMLELKTALDYNLKIVIVNVANSNYGTESSPASFPDIKNCTKHISEEYLTRAFQVKAIQHSLDFFESFYERLLDTFGLKRNEAVSFGHNAGCYWTSISKSPQIAVQFRKKMEKNLSVLKANELEANRLMDFAGDPINTSLSGCLTPELTSLVSFGFLLSSFYLLYQSNHANPFLISSTISASLFEMIEKHKDLISKETFDKLETLARNGLSSQQDPVAQKEITTHFYDKISKRTFIE